MATDLSYDVLIIGGYGHVGLPFGIAMANAGLQVALYDLDAVKGDLIAAGVMPFIEYDAEPILKQVIGRTLHQVRDLSAAAQSKIVVITIGTPLDEHMNPDMLPILKLADQLVPYLRLGHQVMLRSTVFPGTSKRLNEFFGAHGVDVHVSFCPERIAQGYAIRELRRLPQLISGFTEEAIEGSEAIFAELGLQTIVVSIKEAELAKLFSNTWRYIQFAIANQFYMMATEQGADFARVHHAMSYGYERAHDFPNAGFAAGPCLLKDTLQLSAFYQNNFLLGHAATLINEGLPNFLVTRLQRTHDLQKEVVGILGMAFKAEIDDTRDALSYKLGKLLRFHGAKVLYSDEYVKDPTFVSKEDLVAQSSRISLGVPHNAYRTLAIPEQVHVVDVWNILKGPYEKYHCLQISPDPLVDAVPRGA